MTMDMTACVAAADAVVARRPSVLAGLVNDLVWDRRTAPRRPLDPMIGKRHAGRVADAISSDTTLRTAALQVEGTAVVIALLIDRTHAALVKRGLFDLASRGDATTARILFAGAQAAVVHAMVVRGNADQLPIAA